METLTSSLESAIQPSLVHPALQSALQQAQKRMELQSGRKTSDGGGSILPTDLPDDPETPRRTSMKIGQSVGSGAELGGELIGSLTDSITSGASQAAAAADAAASAVSGALPAPLRDAASATLHATAAAAAAATTAITKQMSHDWTETEFNDFKAQVAGTADTRWLRLSRSVLGKPSSPHISSLERLFQKSPMVANRIFDLELSADRQNWRREANGIADSIHRARKYKAQGVRMKFVGDLFMFITSLSGAIVPVLIGLQGSLGETEETIQRNDKLLKYVAISLSIISTVIATFQTVYAYRARGIAKRAISDEMKSLISDYFALTGDFGEQYKQSGFTAHCHSGEAYRTFRKKFNVLAKQARDIDGADNDGFQEDGSSSRGGRSYLHRGV